MSLLFNLRVFGIQLLLLTLKPTAFKSQEQCFENITWQSVYTIAASWVAVVCGVCLVINTIVKAWHRTSMTHLNTFSGWKGEFTKVAQELHSG